MPDDEEEKGERIVKRHGKWVSILLCLLLCAAQVLAADSAAVTAGSVTAERGARVELPIAISGNPGLAAWMFEVSWDTAALALTPSEETVVAGEAFRSGTLLTHQKDDGTLTVSWFTTKNVKADGELFTLRLTVRDTAGGEYPIAVTCSQENTLNVQEQPVPITVHAGSVTVPRPASESSGGAGQTSETVRPVANTQSAPEVPPAANPFTDVATTAYYYDAVQWAVQRNITGGMSATEFRPGATCTRAQTVTFLWRAAGSPEPTAQGSTFGDVDADAYYCKAVQWAVEQGITNGTSETAFSPDAAVTRGQVVTFLWRAAKGGSTGQDNPFGDVRSGDYYYDAVLWASGKGVTNGTSEAAFSPAQGCTRGQIVTFLYRNDGGNER